jgi:hypothetical protein
MSKQLEISHAQYEKDFFRWTQDTADLIRRRRFEEIDLEHVSEENEDMGKRDCREVRSRLAALTRYLLNWQIRPELREASSWLVTINDHRTEVQLILDDSPSLCDIPALLPAVYEVASALAAIETELSIDRFPSACPYTPEQIMDHGYFPEGPLALSS